MAPPTSLTTLIPVLVNSIASTNVKKLSSMCSRAISSCLEIPSKPGGYESVASSGRVSVRLERCEAMRGGGVYLGRIDGGELTNRVRDGLVL